MFFVYVIDYICNCFCPQFYKAIKCKKTKENLHNYNHMIWWFIFAEIASLSQPTIQWEMYEKCVLQCIECEPPEALGRLPIRYFHCLSIEASLKFFGCKQIIFNCIKVCMEWLLFTQKLVFGFGRALNQTLLFTNNLLRNDNFLQIILVLTLSWVHLLENRVQHKSNLNSVQNYRFWTSLYITVGLLLWIT